MFTKILQIPKLETSDKRKITQLFKRFSPSSPDWELLLPLQYIYNARDHLSARYVNTICRIRPSSHFTYSLLSSKHNSQAKNGFYPSKWRKGQSKR